MKAIYGAVEAGGTKFVVAAGRAGEAPLREARIPTTNPEETCHLKKMKDPIHHENMLRPFRNVVRWEEAVSQAR